MLVIQCILWVANMALACSSTNRFWWGNMMAGLILSASFAANTGL